MALVNIELLKTGEVVFVATFVILLLEPRLVVYVLLLAGG